MIKTHMRNIEKISNLLNSENKKKSNFLGPTVSFAERQSF
jgi:hypothetical protein